MTCLQLTVREALNSALDEEMVRDDTVFIIGEEVSLRFDALSAGTLSIELLSPDAFA